MKPLRNVVKALIFFTVFPGFAWAADDTAPTAVVESFQRSLLQVMKEADGLQVKQRYDRLRPVIHEAYQTEVMIRIITGPAWPQATADQQQRVHDAFVRMGVSTLATLFSGYSGETFEILDSRPGPQETVIVATRLVRPKGKPVPISYVTRSYGGRWFIVDVLLNKEISELKVRQSEYRAVLAKEGIEGLIRTLNGKADELVSASK